MELKRSELLPGVWLNHLQSDKFKTACISITLLSQLQRETATLNALIPFVLHRGTTRYGDMAALSRRMDELYGVGIEPVVRRIGEIQCIGFYASLPEGCFLPGKVNVLHDTCELMGEMLLSPATRGGLLLPKYVDSEKENLADIIRSAVNNKHSYAVKRCIEEMCCYEDFCVGRYGDEEDALNIQYRKLTKHYRALLQSAPVEVFYCGRDSEQTVASAMRDALAAMPRTEIDYDIGTDVRMNAVDDEPRSVLEEMDVNQCRLVIGFRLGECMEEPDIPALRVFNAVLGGSSSSKLFMNVRERLQLCYYVNSIIDAHKGLLLVTAGIEEEQLDTARDEVFAQLEAIKRGEVTEEEFRAAKACVASDLRTFCDSQGELEGFYLSQALAGLDYGPMECAELAENVRLEEVVAIANSVECDMIYFLKPGEETEDGEDEYAEEEL